MSQLQHKPRKRSEVLCQSVEEELVIYDLASARAHSLEPSLAAIWNLCDGQRTVEEIALELETSGDVIALGLRRLERADLLETPKISWTLSCSRRDLLKASSRLGGLALASALLPTPAAAASLSKCLEVCTKAGCANAVSGEACFNLPICCCSYYISYPKLQIKKTRFTSCRSTLRCGGTPYPGSGTAILGSKCL